MTIERQWIELMKIEVPEAFSDGCPFVPDAAFIDAQIKLMAMPNSDAPTWHGYLHKQFVMPVHAMFALGATTVILAFDDYAFVPRAKAITQAKRRSRVTPMDFTEQEQLPPTPPVPWDAAMANRAFKAKVVEMVAEALPGLLKASAGSKLVIDWRGTVDEHWTWADNGSCAKTLWPHAKVSTHKMAPSRVLMSSAFSVSSLAFWAWSLALSASSLAFSASSWALSASSLALCASADARAASST